MSSPNTDPIYSKYGDIQWSAPLLLAANDYNCASPNNIRVWEANEDNGGILRFIRFKAAGANVATVARIYINNGLANQSIITAPGTPAGTPATTGGFIHASAHYAKVVPIGMGGDVGAASAESTVVNTTATTGLNSIAWTWTAPQFYVSAYRLHLGYVTTGQTEFFYIPYSTVTASMSATTTMTVTDITDAPDERICPALGIGVVFASGPTAGDYIVKQLTSTETDGAMGKRGTYQMSASRTFSGAAVTDPLKYQQNYTAQSHMGSHDGQITVGNNSLFGEISLPLISAASATSAMSDKDFAFPVGFAMPPGYEIYVGLGTAVAAGWQMCGVGGRNS